MVSEHLNEHLTTILNEWSIDDAADAHDILDYFDALLEEQRQKTK